ncbi:hypothetical protein [Nocardioides sp.]|uniref:hypothetical protein n=1 Tax=Nocardioides sp. TaxID=35761 RepID=UPI0035110119
MNPQSLVLVDLEDGAVPGLVLRSGRDGDRLLVTYEHAGRVVTSWIDVAAVRPS